MVNVTYSIEQLRRDKFHVKRKEAFSTVYKEFPSLHEAVDWIAQDKIDTEDAKLYPRYYDEFGNRIEKE